MHNNVNSLSILDITAHHEMSHAVVAEVLGMPVTYVRLSRIKRTNASLYEVLAKMHGRPAEPEQWHYGRGEEKWMGNTPLNDHPSDVAPLWAVLNLVPDNEYKSIRVRCTIKLAGLVAEKLMGIDERTARNGSTEDISHAMKLIGQSFPPQGRQKELRDAENRAMDILSGPIYWTRVQNLARGLIGSINGGREPDKSNEYLDIYDFSREEIKSYENLG